MLVIGARLEPATLKLIFLTLSWNERGAVAQQSAGSPSDRIQPPSACSNSAQIDMPKVTDEATHNSLPFFAAGCCQWCCIHIVDLAPTCDST